MESLLAKALESKLKYWLKTFTRDQFKLQGRSVLLSNLDLNGDVLHASIGLPAAVRVERASVSRFELKLPSFSNVKAEPTVVEIDKLYLVLVEKSANEGTPVAGSQPSAPTVKSTAYGLADKIADGMTIRVGTVNLTLETRGGSAGHGGAAWTPPLASVTICNLVLYTTNERWKVVSLNEARDYSKKKNCIYVFKKLEWESLSIDLLPHPDMFKDDRITSPNLGDPTRDNDGARRLFFGGERFLDKISGAANITMQRTEQNNPLALEVQLHLPEALCPSLSEPGLRALLRFMTGIYVCLNRVDVDPKTQQSTDAAGRSMVAVHVEHIFLCIKEPEFQLELLMQSLHYVRATAGIGDNIQSMVRLELGAIFLRDGFSRPTCTLIQPSMRNIPTDFPPVPSFASEKSWPRAYPLENQLIPRGGAPPMLCMYSSQTTPSPLPPALASQMVVQCQPLKINLQEQSCKRIASFIADGIVVEPGVVLPDASLNGFYFNLKEFDATIPLNNENGSGEDKTRLEKGFTGARLHVEGFVVAQSPLLTYKLLQLDKDPACFAFWKGQAIDASQQRWVMRASRISVALETESCDDLAQSMNSEDWAAGLWICVEMLDPVVEIAMVSNDGSALVTLPPPGGTVRVGIACKRYISNTSSEQLLFVLKMYAYMVKASESLLGVGCPSNAGVPEGRSAMQETSFVDSSSLLALAPADTAVTLTLNVVELKVLESVPGQITVEGPVLVHILSSGICLRVSHRAFGGAAEVSSTLRWQGIHVECVETHLDGSLLDPLQTPLSRHSSLQQSVPGGDGLPIKSAIPDMRAVFWVGEKIGDKLPNKDAFNNGDVPPFLDVSVTNFIPYKADGESHTLKVSAKVAGIRLGGGMVYNEALLHRFGVLGPDGGPGEDVTKLLKTLSKGPLADVFKPSPMPAATNEGSTSSVKEDDESWEVNMPDNIDLDLQLQDWLLVLEGLDGLTDGKSSLSKMNTTQAWQENCWHSTFRCLRIVACSDDKPVALGQSNGVGKSTSFPVSKITMHIEGLRALKPRSVEHSGDAADEMYLGRPGEKLPDTIAGGLRDKPSTGVSSKARSRGGLDLDVRLVARADPSDADLGMGEWTVDSVRLAVEEPVEVEATKSEVEFLIDLCKAEIESASRIAAGGIKLLNLPIGQSAIEQLSNVGSGSLEKLLTPERARRSTSECLTPDRHRGDSEILTPTAHRRSTLGTGHSDEKIAALEAAASKSQLLLAKIQQRGTCDGTNAQVDSTHDFTSSPELAQLGEQLRHMQTLLSSLRSSPFP